MRVLAVVSLTLLLLGTVAYSAGSAWYVRSDAYRRGCEAVLSSRLELPADIGRVVPRSRRARSFEDVSIWLPQRRDRAVHCDRATLILAPTPEEPDGYELELQGGMAEISTRTWLRDDYRGVVDAGLRGGLAPGGPRRLVFTDMQIDFARDPFRAALHEASGSLVFIGAERGSATLLCREFNGYFPSDPVLLTAQFSQAETGIRIDSLSLQIPAMPMLALGPSRLLGPAVSGGWFDGRLEYSETDAGRLAVLRGVLRDADLHELSAGAAPFIVRGTCPELELIEFRMLNNEPQSLRFRGALADLQLGDFLALIGGERVDGRLDFSVGRALVDVDGVDEIAAAGSGSGIDLEALSAVFGQGLIGGVLEIEISDLLVRDNRLIALDAVVRVRGDDEHPAFVERRLLNTLAQRFLKFTLPGFLPARVPYQELGVRVEVRDEVLRLMGTHGPDGNTILTVSLFGADMGLIRAPLPEIDLRPQFDTWREIAIERMREFQTRRGSDSPD